MKIMILDTYYSKFLEVFYGRRGLLSDLSYKEHRQALLDEWFGTSDFYSYNLKALGHNAEDLIANDMRLQLKWWNERQPSSRRGLADYLPFLSRNKGVDPQEIVLQQVAEAKPDVLYVQILGFFSPANLKKAKQHCKLVVGQIASPLPDKSVLQGFDLLLTSFPHFVNRFRAMGIKSEHFKIGFEARILESFSTASDRPYPVTFVGGYSGHHREAIRNLEAAAREVPIDFWGYGVEALEADSPIRKTYRGEAWAKQMYGVFRQSQITLNRHIDVAENYANNMRLFEATGMGACLITDSKSNLHEYFDIGKEVVTYGSPGELVEKIKYYLEHSLERDAIARAGQARTFKDHGYSGRMAELIPILQNYL